MKWFGYILILVLIIICIVAYAFYENYKKNSDISKILETSFNKGFKDASKKLEYEKK